MGQALSSVRPAQRMVGWMGGGGEDQQHRRGISPVPARFRGSELVSEECDRVCARRQLVPEPQRQVAVRLCEHVLQRRRRQNLRTQGPAKRKRLRVATANLVLRKLEPGMFRYRLKLTYTLAAIAIAACIVLGAGAPRAAQITLLNVSYDPTRELYDAVNAQLAKDWKSTTGDYLTLLRAHG